MSLLGNQSQVVYQARPNMAQTVKEARQQLHKVGRDYKNRPVRIQTIDGMIYEGMISHAEGPFLFIIVSTPQEGHGGYGYPQPRGLFYNQYYYNNVILPLVLYELLVITLLYT